MHALCMPAPSACVALEIRRQLCGFSFYFSRMILPVALDVPTVAATLRLNRRISNYSNDVAKLMLAFVAYDGWEAKMKEDQHGS